MDAKESAVPAKTAPLLQRRQALGALAALACMPRAFAASSTEAWPSRPVKVIVPATAGGVSDSLARLLCEQMTQNLKQPFVVENIVGATGTIGSRQVAVAPPDGHTMLLITSAVLTEVPHVLKTAFDPVKDLLQVGDLVRAPQVMYAHPSLPAGSIKEVVALAKARPGKLSIVSPGTGNRPHFIIVSFNRWAGIDLQRVPYNASVPAINDVLAGHVPLGIDSLPNVMRHVQAGKLKLIAVAATSRDAAVADVPTMEESGFKFPENGGSQAVYIPAATPMPLAERIHDEIARAFDTPKMRERIANTGYTFSRPTSVQEMQATFRREFDRNGDLVKDLAIKAAS